MELFPIVGDKCIWNPIAADNVLPQEPFDAFSCNIHQGFHFHPLSEVVKSYNCESNTPFPRGKGPTTVTPYCEKGQGEEIELNSLGGCLVMLANHWHLLQF
jgi:hypothetical protein